MAVTLAQYTMGAANFEQHYFLSGCNSAFDGRDIQISWDSLATVVNNYIDAHHVDADTVALRFVYCYDAQCSAMYLRLQLCTMTAVTAETGVYDLSTNPCVWFKITNGSIAITTDTSLSDTNYLNHFYYCGTGACAAQTVENLNTNASVYAQNIVFPWEAELVQLYIDNNSPADATIGFTACSFYDNTGTIAYPHNLAIYLCDCDGNALIDNNACDDLKDKAADAGTICPQFCALYIAPISPING